MTVWRARCDRCGRVAIDSTGIYGHFPTHAAAVYAAMDEEWLIRDPSERIYCVPCVRAFKATKQRGADDRVRV